MSLFHVFYRTRHKICKKVSENVTLSILHPPFVYITALFRRNACANFLRKPATFGRGSAGFRGKIVRWLKTAVYQSYVGDHAVKQAFNSMSLSLVLFLQYGLLLIIAFGNGEYSISLSEHFTFQFRRIIM